MQLLGPDREESYFYQTKKLKCFIGQWLPNYLKMLGHQTSHWPPLREQFWVHHRREEMEEGGIASYWIDAALKYKGGITQDVKRLKMWDFYSLFFWFS